MKSCSYSDRKLSQLCSYHRFIEHEGEAWGHGDYNFGGLIQDLGIMAQHSFASRLITIFTAWSEVQSQHSCRAQWPRKHRFTVSTRVLACTKAGGYKLLELL